MWRVNDEEGATAVMVALLLVPLIVAAAFVVDFGLIYWEVRQLQNGADAAALAVAQDCAAGEPCTAAAAGPTAQRYADANAKDGASAILKVAIPGDDGPNCVTVTTGTRSADGEPTLAHVLSRVIGIDSTTWKRSATASWGTMGSGTTIPLTFSYCEWKVFTGLDFTATQEQITAALPTDVRVIYHHTNSASDLNDCDGPAGQDTSGGFGWLDEEGPCSAFIENGEVEADTGASMSKACKAVFEGLVGETVLIPIFVEVTGQGTKSVYEIGGFAGFEFHGYRFPGEASSPAPCDAPNTCVSGRFVQYYELGAEPADGEIDFGAYVVGLTG